MFFTATRCRLLSVIKCGCTMTETPDLAALFARHKKAVLAFSGGKDSLQGSGVDLVTAVTRAFNAP